MGIQDLENLQQAGTQELSLADERQRVGRQRDTLLIGNGSAADRVGLNAPCDVQPAGISATLWHEPQDIVARWQGKIPILAPRFSAAR